VGSRRRMTEFSRRDAIQAGLKACAAAVVAQPFRAARAAQTADVEIIGARVSAVTTRVTVVPRGQRDVRGDGSLLERPWPRTTIDLKSLGLSFDPQSGALRFPIRGTLLGLGEGGPQFDRRGSTITARSGQGGYQLRTHGGRVPIQWLISADGWALYFHQPLGAFDLTGPRGRFDPPQDAPLPLDVFVVDARDPVAAMGEFARLTGTPEMPPLWSFGYQQSHRTLSGPDEVRWVAKSFREKHLPCDTLIYLGTGFTPSGWNTQNGEFTWNPATFPDPQGILAELHGMHYRVVL